jgi:hypothetical protein
MILFYLTVRLLYNDNEKEKYTNIRTQDKKVALKCLALKISQINF